MKGSFLVDSNVLVYAYDRSEPEKQVKALTILDELVQRQIGVLSAQVLAEFFVTVVRKIKAPLTPKEGYDRVMNYLQSWMIVEITPPIVGEAARAVRDYKLSYWDAQIWATAKLNQIPIILSEDFSDGHQIEGVRFLNPFKSGFSLP